MKQIRLPSGEYVEDRRNGNGASKIVWTTMVSACGVVFIGFMAWMTSMNGHILNVEATMNMRWERLAAVETLLMSVDERVKRVENKLDALFEKKR